MTNLPITSNNSQLSANVASTARKDGVANEQPADPFGAVLARQMDEANASAPNTPSSAAGLDTKATAESTESTGKTEPDQVSAADCAPIDPSNALAVMLQLPQEILPQEIKAPVTKEASDKKTATALELCVGKEANQLLDNINASLANTSAAGALKPSGGKAETNQLPNNISASLTNTSAAEILKPSGGRTETNQLPNNISASLANTSAAETLKPSGGKTETNQLPNNISASLANTSAAKTLKPSSGKTETNQLLDNPSASLANPPGKADAAIMAADRSALHSGSGLEITKSGELPNSLLSAGHSAQGVAQSAASMAASITSGMSTYSKASDSMQTISSPLGSSAWPDEFSQKISWMSTQQNQVAELHLNPPNLGPLDVTLKISDNQATALFTSPHSAVRDAVENALPRLREMLADNGITLGNTTVSDQPPRDRSADGFSGNGFGTAAQRQSSDEASRLAGLSPAAIQPLPIRRHNGMVDTFA